MRLRAMIVAGACLVPATAGADDFDPGSYIVPMDLDYQDQGMFRAYGLVYDLLRAGVPVRWVIRSGKNFGEEDFTAQSVDFATGAVIGGHDYRGGPWVIDSFDAADAEPIIDAWLATYPETTVHEVTESFSADVSRYLVVAPTLAMVADGNENIARDYMLAAGIPDSALDLSWPDTSPDMLDIDELSGPTDVSHTDGSLFDEDGDPVYCQLMSMHWGVGNAENNPEVVAETRAFLNNPTHFFAECQAVNAFENLNPHGFFLTPNGFEFGDQPADVDFYNADSPFGQLDGAWETVGGSEPSYTLPVGDSYKAGDIVMITAAGTPEGEEDVWMTGFLDGQCPPDQHECGPYGKISYLGGHRYSTNVPVSGNADSQGTRMFLNSLFEAPCATVEGLPNLAVAVDAPEQTTEPDVTFKITYVNTSFATALNVVLTDTLPPGATFVSATGGGALAGSDVSWDLGNLGPGESGDLEIEVQLEDFGIYPNSAQLDFQVGLTPLSQDSNVSQTEYGDDFPSGTSSGGPADSGSGESGATASGDTDSGSDSASAGSSDGPDPTIGDGSSGGSSGPAQGESVDGCGCTLSPSGAGGAWLAAIGLLGLLRRRRAATVVAVAVGTGCASDKPEETGETGSLSMTADDTGDDASDPDTGPEKLDANPSVDMFVPEPEVGCQAIDFLFIIDSSESMKDHQANLIASFPGFATEIEAAVPSDDWHVMVVDTDGQWGGAECANACSTLGSCPDEPNFACNTPAPELCDITIGAGESAPYGEGASNEECLDGEARFLAEGEADLGTVFGCMAQVGVDGNSEERTAEALVRAVSPEMLADDSCNAGFLRDEAILVITIITDEPDAISPDEPPDWMNALLEAKNDDPGGIVILGLIPDGGSVCEDPADAPRLEALLDSFPNNSSASVCEPDYSPFFADAVEVILDTCEEFEPPPPQP